MQSRSAARRYKVFAYGFVIIAVTVMFVLPLLRTAKEFIQHFSSIPASIDEVPKSLSGRIIGVVPSSYNVTGTAPTVSDLTVATPEDRPVSYTHLTLPTILRV